MVSPSICLFVKFYPHFLEWSVGLSVCYILSVNCIKALQFPLGQTMPESSFGLVFMMTISMIMMVMIITNRRFTLNLIKWTSPGTNDTKVPSFFSSPNLPPLTD